MENTLRGSSNYSIYICNRSCRKRTRENGKEVRFNESLQTQKKTCGLRSEAHSGVPRTINKNLNMKGKPRHIVRKMLHFSDLIPTQE